MKFFAQEWSTFEATTLPAEASDVQRKEMRRAFLSGAYALHMLLLANVDSPSTLMAIVDEVEQSIRSIIKSEAPRDGNGPVFKQEEDPPCGPFDERM